MKPIKLMKKVLAVVLCLSLVSISPASGAEGTELNATEQTAAVASQSTEQSAQSDTTAQVPSNTESASTQQTNTSAPASTEPATQTPSTEKVSTEQPSTQSPSTETASETKPTETGSTEQPSTQAVSTETQSTETPSTEVKPTETVSTETSTEQSTEDSKPETVRFHYTSDVVDVVVTTSDEKALPENAELVVTPVAITDEMQTALDAQAVEKQQAIDSASAFDIKFMVDGQEIEPGDTVHVQVSIPQVTAGENASVYHYVDDSTTVTDMGATVAADGVVGFDTNHFSTYVIVNNGTSQVTLTLQHYYMDGTTAKKLYQDDTRILPVGSKVNNYKKATNWGVSRVVTIANGAETVVPDINSISITANTTIRVYYSKTGTDSVNRNVTGNVALYDYVVKPLSGRDPDPLSSINTSANYTGTGTNFFTVGTYNQNYESNSFDTILNNQHVNKYNNGSRVLGIIAGLSDDYKNVLFNPALNAPDLFSDKDAKGKSVINNYSLVFAQSADDYTFTAMNNEAGSQVASAGEGFFPLESRINSPKDANNTDHNYYFGMRYDVAFTLGDYVGPLKFNFTGDDDLWVLLDGKVVLDIGGIHDAITDNIDLWSKLGMVEGTGATGDAKTQIHRLTVLYMERGAGKSNCNMSYTIPEATLINVTNETTNVTFTKTDSQGKGLQYADFKLVNDSDATKTYTATSGADGTVTFSNVKTGTYTMSETAAPTGYTASKDTWKVVVTASNNVVGFNIYQADGTTPLTNNKIINLTQQEVIQKYLNYSKTATLDNWDNRTYNINISASAKGSTSTTTKKNADVMMVFDLSGSMNGSLDGGLSPSPVSVGKFKNVYTTLDANSVYYTVDTMIIPDVSGSGYQYPGNIIRNFSGTWMTCQAGGSTWTAISNSSNMNVYTWPSRISALKNAASGFTSGLASSSPTSKIGLASFYGESQWWSSTTTGYLNYGLSTITSNPLALLKNINGLVADGGTSPQKGLDIAKSELANANDSNAKYVILFTDGEPSTDNDSTATEASAKKLRDAGYTVITVGFGLSATTASWLSDSIASSANWAFTATNSSQLSQIFANLETTITQNVEIYPAQITDVIDARFELASGVETTLLADGATVTKNSDGTTTVTWLNQKLPNVNVGSWNKTIKVKAKDTFIGGNNITTNVKDVSFISIPTGTVSLPQPAVNVKAEYSVNSANNTIFLGDHISTDATILNRLFNTGAIKNKAGTTTFTGTNPDNFALSWYTDTNLTTPITLAEMAAVYPTDLTAATTYYLKVLYDAGSPTNESTTNSGNHVAGDTNNKVQAVNPADNKAYGTYITNVVAGTLKVTKDMSAAGSYYRAIQGDPIFTFKITNTTTNKVFYKTLRFESNGTSLSATLTGLEKGTYRVEELKTIRYSLNSVSVDTANTNCYYTPVVTGDKTVSVQIGKGGSNTSIGDKAAVVFTNVKNKESRNLTDTDVVKNTFKLNEKLTSTVHADNQ